jgi:hypothetical protein
MENGSAQTEEDFLTFNISDDALERSAAGNWGAVFL